MAYLHHMSRYIKENTVLKFLAKKKKKYSIIKVCQNFLFTIAIILLSNKHSAILNDRYDWHNQMAKINQRENIRGSLHSTGKAYSFHHYLHSATDSLSSY